MNDVTGAHLLLGKADQGELILLIGPDYGRMQQSAAEAGIETRDANRVRDLDLIKKSLAASGRSLALTASTPEVEGILDRSSFPGDLARIAYDYADRVIYFGTLGAVLLHPSSRGVYMRLQHGRLQVRPEIGANSRPVTTG